MTTKTFRSSLGRSLLKGGAWFGITAIALTATSVYTSNMDKVDAGPSWPEQVAERHACEKPAEGVLPSAVIGAREGDVAVKYLASDKAVGAALDFALNGEENGFVTVYRFCA